MFRRWWNLALLIGGLGVGFACAEATGKDKVEGEVPAAAPQLPPEYNPVHSLAPLVERLQPAVVNLYVEQKVEVPASVMQSPFGPFFGFPHGMPQEEDGQDGQGGGRYRVQEGQGSGFIISADGYILTNNHVVADAVNVKVKLSDDRELEAKVVGTDERTDVALVKVDAGKDLPFVKLGSSEHARVGDWVVAIGNPYGLSHTVTAGIVSAKGRVIGAGPYDDFIQTDASINPGNSGGPLFNLAGEVVGINSAIVNQANSIGFAIPIDMVRAILEDLKSTGRVARGWMGLSLQGLDPALAQALKVPGETKGVVVSQVYPGFPAAEAGLQPSDVITKLDGKQVSSSEELVRTVGSYRPGQKVEVTLLRAGKERTLSVTLAERPGEEALAKGDFSPDDQQPAPEKSGKAAPTGATPLSRLGLTLEDAARYQMGADGLVVTRVSEDGPAADKLSRGDVIVAVNNQAVRSVADVNKALSEGDVALFTVRRENSQRLVAVPLR